MGLLRRLLRNGSWVEHWNVSWFENGVGDWLYVQLWLYGTKICPNYIRRGKFRGWHFVRGSLSQENEV
jgi:hypothetical protein